MNYLDMRTVILSYAISNLICMIVMASLWHQNRKRFAGMELWLADFILQFVALVLISMRGVVPDLLSMTGSNSIVIGGTLLLLMGLERFVDRRSAMIHNYLFLAAFVMVHGYFAIISPNMLVRNIIFSAGVAWISIQGAWLMLRRVSPEMRPITRGIGYVLSGFFVISIIRIFIDIAMPPANDFFQSNVYDTLVLMTYQVLFIILTFAIFLMVNRRLVAALEGDISARIKVESALRYSEEKFFKAFHSSPDAILISRMSDGRLIEVNDGFTSMTGYSREEALSASTISLGLWPNLKDRERLVDALQKTHRIRDYELEFRTKSGKIIHSLCSGEVFDLFGEAHILSVVRDITVRRHMEDELRKTNELFSQFMRHSPIYVFIKEVSATDSRVLQASENFSDMIGIAGSDMVGKTMTELFPPEFAKKITSDDQDVVRVGKVLKLDEYLGGRYYTTIKFPIVQDDKTLLAGYTVDITDRKRIEKVLQLRVDMIEYAEKNPITGLIQKALDEICEITGSPVGFYHLVEEDQKTLTLQAWSTRTLMEFCKAEGEGMHYSIDKAGVWVECIHERKPIIHNDYASLPNRKGLPPGHAEVVRELVVPILRNGLVVSVLGVGNKSSDYDDNDIQLVSYISDIIWGIIERKKTLEDLGDSVKELNCLYEISKLLIDPANTFEAIVTKTINIIPQSSRHSKVTCARIIVEGRTYNTSNFFESPWRQLSYIRFQGNKIGTVEVFYLEENGQSHEKPFLPEERALIEGISELLSIAFERKKAEEKLKLLKKAMDTIEIGVTISDRNGNITYTNPAEAKMHGYDVADLIGRQASIFGPSKPRQSYPVLNLDDMVHWKREGVNVSADGSSFPVQLISTPVKDDSEKAIGIVTISEDITERKRIEEQLKQLAATDPLTGCYNRRYFFELGETEVKRTKRYGNALSVLMMDIDHFKKINDEHGHAVGDQTLIALAKTCLSSIRITDIFGRLGGEEFGIIFVEAKLDDAIVMAERIRNELSKMEVQADKDFFNFSVSIGVTEVKQSDVGLEDILKRADKALYEAKNEGRNCVKVL